MQTQVNVQEAKTRLSELLRLVEAGEEIVISRSGNPIAVLSALEKKQRDFSKPLLTGTPTVDASSTFNNTLDEIETLDWYHFEEEQLDD